MPERHRRDLRVEQRLGHLAGQIVDDLEVLAAGVEDLQRVMVVDQQVEERREVDVRLRIDRRRFLGARNLDEAEVRPIGILAHELSVHGDEGLLGKALDEGNQVFGPGDQWMNLHVSARGLSRLPAG